MARSMKKSFGIDKENTKVKSGLKKDRMKKKGKRIKKTRRLDNEQLISIKAPKCFNILKKKYNIASWEDIITNFGIDKIDEKCGTACTETECLNQLSSKIIEKLESLTRFLNHLLQPDTDIVSLQESEALDNKQKDKAFNLLSKAMVLQRKHLKAVLLNNKQLQVEFINQALDFWIREKKEFANLIDNVSKVWYRHNKQNQRLEYLG